MDASLQPRSMAGHLARGRISPEGLAGLRVALVHDWLTGRRGGEKCLEVLCRVFPEATIHTLLHVPGSVGPTIERLAIRTSPFQKMPGIQHYYRHLLPLMPMAARAWDVGPVDLVISLSHCVAKSVRTPAGVPHICYCFTPMRYAWEGRAAYFEGWRGRPIKRAMASAVLDRLRSWDRATARGVSHFVAISRTVQGRIQESYGRESRVVYPPVDTEFYTPGGVEPAARRQAPYLCVSALVGYKRLDRAIAACTARGTALTVIGSGPERSRLESLAGPNVRFLGWQPDEVIREHYRTCRALLFPGEEDFGIVPIEALACGAPVIALGRGGAMETIDNGVGRLFPEPSAESLGRALDDWEADGQPYDPALARRRAEDLSTGRFEDRLVELIRGVVAGAPSDRVPPPPHVRVSRRGRKSGEKRLSGG